jgi:hypothetical protein
MKRLGRLCCLVGVFAVGLLCASAAQAVPLVRILAPAFVNLNDTFTVQIQVEDLGVGVAPSVGAWDLDILFNETDLSAQSATYGDPIQGNQLNPSNLLNGTTDAVPGLDNLNGIVDLAQLSNAIVTVADLNTNQVDVFILAEIEFQAISAGVTLLELCTPNVGGCLLGDAAGIALTWGARPLNGLVVNVLPEPSMAWIALAPAALLVARRRRP